MKHLYVSSAILLFITSPVAWSSETLSATNVPECEYHELTINALSTVNFVAAGNAQGSVKGSAAELANLTYTCANGTLEINTKPNVIITQGFTFTLQNRAIDQVTLNGAQSMKMTDLANKTFRLIMDGSGDFSATGKVEHLDVLLNGAAEVDLSALHATNSKVTVNGAGSAQVNVAATLNAEVNGAGTISYIGSPLALNQKVNGSGTITQEQ
ncbi:GIN domain-containing protein [Aeromonas sp. MdU4]|uniref:GIN domain-containing protein n=1 Tax=Aeromonas sp. MdU4 TaxID=3342819 RepID=UPI0035B8357E